MKICPTCNAQNEDDGGFCTECGGKFPAAPEPQACLKFSNNYEISFSETQQVIGRSELSATAKTLGADPLEISRQHLTIYSESNKCYIVDGTTSVQEKPSSNHTKVNGKDITDQGAIELNDGDEIQFATTVKAIFHGNAGNSDTSNTENNDNSTDSTANKMSDDEIKNKYDNMPDM